MGKKISKLEEIALLKRVAQGDAKAIRQMVDLFSDMAFSLAMRVLKNKEDAPPSIVFDIKRPNESLLKEFGW